MNIRQQQVGVGIFFALTTAVTWGALPIAMKQVLVAMDPFTVVWYRFVMATLGLGVVLVVRGSLPPMRVIRRPRVLWLLLIATLGLVGNFVLFSSSLQYLSPTAAQVIGQLSPVGMMFASVLILKERMCPTQLIGVTTLFIGLLLFFNRSLIEIFTSFTQYTLGILLGVAAAAVWVTYGIAQKVLLRHLGAPQLLLILYAASIVFIFPFAHPIAILQLSGWQLACLLFCGANTLIGYGALAEAMARWQAAQVSALVTLTPLFTLFFSDLLVLVWPGIFTAPTLNTLGYLGAFVVVAGAMFSAIGHRWWSARSKNYLDAPLN